MILFNNKDILIGGKPFLFEKWFNKKFLIIVVVICYVSLEATSLGIHY